MICCWGWSCTTGWSQPCRYMWFLHSWQELGSTAHPNQCSSQWEGQGMARDGHREQQQDQGTQQHPSVSTTTLHLQAFALGILLELLCMERHQPETRLGQMLGVGYLSSAVLSLDKGHLTAHSSTLWWHLLVIQTSQSATKQESGAQLCLNEKRNNMQSHRASPQAGSAIKLLSNVKRPARSCTPTTRNSSFPSRLGRFPANISHPPSPQTNIPRLGNMRYLPGCAPGEGHERSILSHQWDHPGFQQAPAYLPVCALTNLWLLSGRPSAYPLVWGCRNPHSESGMLGEASMAQLPPELWQAGNRALPSHLQTCLCSSPC